jgi:hypothetical protein
LKKACDVSSQASRKTFYVKENHNGRAIGSVIRGRGHRRIHQRHFEALIRHYLPNFRLRVSPVCSGDTSALLFQRKWSMIPIIPIVLGSSVLAGLFGLYWYDELSKEQKQPLGNIGGIPRRATNRTNPASMTAAECIIPGGPQMF